MGDRHWYGSGVQLDVEKAGTYYVKAVEKDANPEVKELHLQHNLLHQVKGPPRGNRDGVLRNISKRELNGKNCVIA